MADKKATGKAAKPVTDKGRAAASRKATKPAATKVQAKAAPAKVESLAKKTAKPKATSKQKTPKVKTLGEPACRTRTDAPVGPIEFTRLDKVLFPADGITKGDLIEYYQQVAPFMLPHIIGRPTTMQRYPDGIQKFAFYQKETPEYFPDWIQQVEVEKKPTWQDPDDWQCQVICDKPETLMYLANQACITMHTWLSRKPDLHLPDRLIFDLDPSVENFEAIKQGARDMRALLDELALPSFLMTTGSRGLHLTVPIKPELDFDAVKAFAKKISERLVAQSPDLYTIEHRKAKRGDRIFVDYLRNEYAQTAVPPYAVRARDGAPVATPLDWSELDKLKSAQAFNIKTVIARLKKQGDSWADIERHAVSIRKPAAEFS